MPMQNTLKHPDQFGAGSLNAIFSKRLDITTFATDADALDCLYISYIPEIEPSGTPAIRPSNGTVQVDADGAGSNKCRITLRVENQAADGSANSDVSFTIDCDGSANGDWSSGNVTILDLKGIIDAINQDDAVGTSGKLLRGFKAWIGPGGMYDMVVTGTLMFQDEAEQSVLPGGGTGGYTGFLKRDMAVHTIDSDFLAYWRIGEPEVRDRGLLKLLDIYGTIGTDTGCTVYVVRDDVADYVKPTGTWATDIANHEVVWQCAAGSVSANAGSSPGLPYYVDRAGVVRPPLVLIVKGDTDAAQTVNLVASLQAVSM